MRKKKYRTTLTVLFLMAAMSGLTGCKKKPKDPLPTTMPTKSITPAATLLPSPVPTPVPTVVVPKVTTTPILITGTVTPEPVATAVPSSTPEPTKVQKPTPEPTRELIPTAAPTPRPETPTTAPEPTKAMDEKTDEEPEVTKEPEPTKEPTPTPEPTKAPDYAGLMTAGWQSVSDLEGRKTVYFPAIFREAEPIYTENFFGFAYSTQDGKRSTFRMIHENWNEGESLSKWIQLRYENCETVKESEDDYSFSFEENNRLGKGRIYFCNEEKTAVMWLELLWDGDPSAEEFDFFLR